MTLIEQVLAGNIHINEFIGILKVDQELQEQIRNLLPQDAKANAVHGFWKIVPYESLRCNNFDYYQFLFWRLTAKGTIGNNLTIYSRLQRAYQFYCPDVQCTNRYENEFYVYLDAVKDCFDGPEVRTIVEHIINDSLQFRSKTQKSKYAKSAIHYQFHIENNRRPRWIQGPEWPMGKLSPMAFVSQNSDGDAVQYVFKDADTNEIRVIEQWY